MYRTIRKQEIGEESFIAPLEGEAANQNPIGKVWGA
jgi:hypothetical protein